jgi:transposase
VCWDWGRSQKNDPNDARSVAIAALRSERLQRVVIDDHAQVLRLLVKRHRDTAQLRAKQLVRLSALATELSAGEGVEYSFTQCLSAFRG